MGLGTADHAPQHRMMPPEGVIPGEQPVLPPDLLLPQRPPDRIGLLARAAGNSIDPLLGQVLHRVQLLDHPQHRRCTHAVGLSGIEELAPLGQQVLARGKGDCAGIHPRRIRAIRLPWRAGRG